MNTRKIVCFVLLFFLLQIGNINAFAIDDHEHDDLFKIVEVKNGSKVAVSVNEGKFSATEYYEKIKETNIATLIDMIDKSILEKKFKDVDSKEEDESVVR